MEFRRVLCRSRNGCKAASAGGKQRSQAYTSALTTGQVDVLFDTLAFPLQPEFDSEGHSRGLAPSRSTATTYTAKFAGPLGFARLPGGLPVATIVGEMRRQAFGDSILVADSPGTSSISYSTKRNLSTQDVFGGLYLPVHSADKTCPLYHDLPLTLTTLS